MSQRARVLALGLVASSLLSIALPAAEATLDAKKAKKPLRGLLVAGGCCHDYKEQVKILSEGISARANIEWTIIRRGSKRDVRVEIYEKEGWEKGYDVVLHNECYGGVTDVEFVENIARAHKAGLPAVVLHCSMHSYRNAKTDEWRKVLGVTSRSHEGHRAVTVEKLVKDSVILKSLPDSWKTPAGELYKIEKLGIVHLVDFV